MNAAPPTVVPTQVDKLTAMLERTVDRLKTTAGKALVAPCNQMRRPETAVGDLLFGGGVPSGCNGTSLDLSRHRVLPETDLVHKVNF